MKTKLLVIFWTIFFCGVFTIASQEKDEIALRPGERLSYAVNYKWGLINKQAGTAVLSLQDKGKTYRATLTASSAPWADKFYKVRDTLNGVMEKNSLRPLHYEKIAHEGKDDKHDKVEFTYSQFDKSVTATCSRKEVNNGKIKINETKTLTGNSPAVDMLTSFYLMRTLPYSTWEPGQAYEATIFSGKQKELLKIKYLGKEQIDIGNKTADAYHITFTFTSDGTKKTSDDMEAWISTTSDRIPLQLVGKLPVGKVRCILLDK